MRFAIKSISDKLNQMQDALQPLLLWLPWKFIARTVVIQEQSCANVATVSISAKITNLTTQVRNRESLNQEVPFSKVVLMELFLYLELSVILISNK